MLITHLNISLYPKPSLHLSIITILFVALAVGLTPTLSFASSYQVAYGENELRLKYGPTQGQSAAFNAGFSQGYLEVPFKGGHTEQFIHGYINGTKELQNDKAEVAGYMGMPFHGDNQSMFYYMQGKGIRSDVECGDQEPIGTLPTHTDDNYKLFYEGYHDGSLLRDSSDPGEDPNNNPNCPLGHSTEYCAGFKFGWNNGEALINPPDDYDCPEANK